MTSLIDNYLVKVRAALRGLPQAEIEDILRELRSHAEELAADQGMGPALGSLGDPVDLAKTYQAEHSRARAACSNSPLVILEGLRQSSHGRTHRVALTALYVFGYSSVLSLWATALDKLASAPRTGWALATANLAGGLLLKYVIDLTARWWIQRYMQQRELRA